MNQCRIIFAGLCMFVSFVVSAQSSKTSNNRVKPNIILIYADDLGYGDLSCYGAEKIHTPNIDKLAKQGLSFTNAHASSATCTPSRYSVLTGEYAWRKKGTSIAPGDAPLLIDTGILTLPSMLQKAGYQTAAIGKWHLGLGSKKGQQDWNGEIKPGPLEIGFNYSFIIPATLDRVPTIYVERHHTVNLDPADLITVSYKEKVGEDPIGKDHPELLKMKPSNGHDQTIVNGVSRIGYMSGGKSARWKDEEVAGTLTDKASHFIEKNQNGPFFLYFASGDPHVPRVPHPSFVGKSGMGPRGDAILQLDWCVGKLLKVIDSLDLRDNTLILFSSDNGPVLDDGYQDNAVEKLNGHKPSGILRGGKYSAFESGTRVPLIIRWPGTIKAGIKSDALISQVDFTSSFAKMLDQPLKHTEAFDSVDLLNALLGKSKKGRVSLVEHAGALSLIKGNWKYIAPNKGPRIDHTVNIELGNDLEPQLYNLKTDIRERINLAQMKPRKVERMAEVLYKIQNDRPNH